MSRKKLLAAEIGTVTGGGASGSASDHVDALTVGMPWTENGGKPPVQSRTASPPLRVRLRRTGVLKTETVSLKVVLPPKAGAQVVFSVAVTTITLVFSAASGTLLTIQEVFPADLVVLAVPLAWLARIAQVTLVISATVALAVQARSMAGAPVTDGGGPSAPAISTANGDAGG